VPANMKGAGGLIVMGARWVLSDGSLPWLPDEMRLIEDAMKSNLPVLGVCLGAQILARRSARRSNAIPTARKSDGIRSA